MADALTQELERIGRAIAAISAQIHDLCQQEPVPLDKLREMESRLKELFDRYFRLNAI